MANFETEEKRRRRRTARKRTDWFSLYVQGCLVGTYVLVSWLVIMEEPVGWVLLMPLVVVAYVRVQRWWNFDAIVLRGLNARLVDQSDAPQVHNVVEEVCIAAGIGKPRVAVIDDPALNAFSLGMWDTRRNVVVFTSGLLAALDRDELQGVVAHEIAQLADCPESYFHADAAAVRLTRNPAGLRRALERVASDSSAVRRSPGELRYLWFVDPGDGFPGFPHGGPRRGRPVLARREPAGRRVHPRLDDRVEALRRVEGDAPTS